MSDVLDCPDCEGTGRQRIGGLVMACRFCAGQGKVGGKYGEPAEDPPIDPDDSSIPPIWDLPGARIDVCPQCQGQGAVFHAVNDDGGGMRTLLEVPCPACRA